MTALVRGLALGVSPDGPELETDPLECLRLRQVTDPDDYAPPCGEWLSDHCPDCQLCPGYHADNCTEEA